MKRSRADQQAGEGQHGREGGRACGLQAQQVMDRVSPRSAARANQQSMMQHTQVLTSKNAISLLCVQLLV